MNVNKCAICRAVFGTWPEFNMHHKQTHNVFSTVIKPEKTTNRTKPEIVRDYENKHSEIFL